MKKKEKRPIPAPEELAELSRLYQRRRDLRNYILAYRDTRLEPLRAAIATVNKEAQASPASAGGVGPG